VRLIYRVAAVAH